MGKRKTNKEFSKEVYNLVGNEYTFLEEYVNSSTKIKVRHNCKTCNNNEYFTKPNSFLGGDRCPKCSSIKRRGKSYPKFTVCDWNEHFEKNLKYSYEQLTEFKGLKNIITLKHKPCGSIISIQANNFKVGKPCRYCSQKKTNEQQRKTHDEFCLEVKTLGNDEFEVIEKYQGNHKPVKLKHTICGNEFTVAPNDFKKGQRCPKCSILKRRLSQEEWENRVSKLTGKEYTFLEKYKGNGMKIKVKHEKCGNVYAVKPNNYLSGYRCPICKSSIGEQLLVNFLTNKDITFIPQYYFNNLRGNKGYLRYDFYLPEYNILIEYNGIQHYKPVEFFGGLKTYKRQLERDNIKRQYAVDNNISLIEVPFYVSTKELIEEKLNYELNKYYSVKQGNL
ncbi:hypothetical protein VL10_ORF75 [Staphylococcus phage vB_SauM_VL10]|nr:hypothetical protein VL10_ORF75 [Staphylococcus phage vB_SauM_VL10]